MLNKKQWYKLLALPVAMAVFIGEMSVLAATGPADVQTATAETVESDDNTYAAYGARYAEQIYPNDRVAAVPTAAQEVEGRPASRIEEGKTGEFSLEVKQSGLYRIRLGYYLFPTKEKDGMLSLKIDGEVPFAEADRVSVNRIWVDSSAGNIERDQQGNDIRPTQMQQPQWTQTVLADIDGYYSDPYAFYFDAGVHTVTLTSTTGDFAVDSVEIFNEDTVPAYAQVREQYKAAGYTQAPAYQELIRAELPIRKSSSMLYPLYDRSSPATQPSHYSRIRLNTIGGSNWGTAGQWIEWKITVPHDGLYTLSFKARQNLVEGLNSYRVLSIDGKVPFAEAKEIAFAYSVGWYMLTLSADGDPCEIYLTEGEHTLRLTANAGPMAAVVRDLENDVFLLNQMYRNIIMVTGVDPDIYRTFEMEKEMPGITQEMEQIVDRLADLSKRVRSICGEGGSQASIVDQVEAALRKMLKNINRLPNQLGAFNDHIESLGTLLQTMRSQPVELDYLVLSSQNALPDVDAGFFEKLVYNTKSFFASFVEDYSSLATTDDARAITVWVSSGRDQAQIIKKLMDDRFTAQYGINVNLSLVTDSLINAILAGQGPDVALMVDQTTPVNLAMRGALQDLSVFDNCDQVLDRFQASAVEPFRYQGGVYALPNTQDFDMLFYRKDILDELMLKVPDTWEEFYQVLAILQKHNLTVGVPETNTVNLGISSGITTFNKFLLQNGGEYYNADHTKTLFDTTVSYQAFTRWTELYTKYGLDREFNFYNRFRSGEMPLGIQPYSMYNQLTQAAPEIRGLWGFTVIPGTLKEDGTVDRSDSSTITGCVMLRDAVDPQTAWKLMDWWSGSDTQAQYGNELEATMGVAARYAVANTEAFASLNWTEEEQAVLKEQWNNVVGIPEIPGSYFVSRCLTNAFRNVLSGTTTPIKSINTYNKDINAEITRKRKEFNLD